MKRLCCAVNEIWQCKKCLTRFCTEHNGIDASLSEKGYKDCCMDEYCYPCLQAGTSCDVEHKPEKE